jgi:hypothetical protein
MRQAANFTLSAPLTDWPDVTGTGGQGCRACPRVQQHRRGLEATAGSTPGSARQGDLPARQCALNCQVHFHANHPPARTCCKSRAASADPLAVRSQEVAASKTGHEAEAASLAAEHDKEVKRLHAEQQAQATSAIEQHTEVTAPLVHPQVAIAHSPGPAQ